MVIDSDGNVVGVNGLAAATVKVGEPLTTDVARHYGALPLIGDSGLRVVLLAEAGGIDSAAGDDDLNGFPMTYEIRPDGTIQALNAGIRVVERVLATPIATLADAARLWDARVHPDDRSAHALFRQTVARGERAELEYRIVGFDGVERRVWTRDRPYRERSGRMLVEGVVFDVTERHAVRSALDAARDRLQTVLETINEVVFEVLVAPDGALSVSHAGPGMDRLLGAPVGPGENPLAALRARIHRDDQERYLLHLADVMRGVDSAIECRVVGASEGSYRWMWIRSRPVNEDAGDLRVAVVISDVDDLRAAAERRDSAELQIQELLASGEDVLSIDEIQDDGRLVSVYAPPNVSRFYGEAVSGAQAADRWARALHPDDRARVLATYKRHRELGTISLEYRIVRADGSVRTVWDRSRAFVGQNGRWYAAGAMTDVTDHRRFAKESEYLRALSDAVTDDLYVDLHRPDGTVENVFESPAGRRIFGTTNPDRVAQWFQAVLPEDRPLLAETYAAVAAGEPFAVTYRVRDAAGAVRIVNDVGAPAGDGPDGRLVAGIVRDVTEQTRIGRSLIEREADMRAVAHAIDEVLYVDHARDDGTFETIFVDDATHGLYGGTPGGVGFGVGVWMTHIHPDDAATFHAGIAQALAGDQQVDMVYRLLGVDGVTRYIEDRPRAFRAADGRLLVAGTIREVPRPG